jgi:hypothetical protein
VRIRPKIAVTHARLSLTFQPNFPMQHIDLESAVSRQSWEWLVDLAPRLDIIIETVDSHGVPVFPVGSTEAAAVFRTMLTAPESSLHAAIANVPSKKPIFLSIDTLQVVCCGLSTGGVLCVARNLTSPDSVDECNQDLESIANWLASAIEASLTQTSSISVESYRIVSFRRILREATSRGSIRKVIGAFIEALSVWDDVRVRCYIAGAGGGFLQYGSALTTLPSSPDRLDEAVAPPHGRMVRLSRADVDRLGLISEPGDTLLLRVLVGDIAWLLVFSGMIDDREQVRLRLYSDILRESLSDVVTMMTSRLVAEVSRPQRPSNEPPETTAQTALDQLTAAVSGHRGAMTVTTVGGRQLLAVGHADLFLSPDQSWRDRLEVKSSDSETVMTVTFEREQGPFTAFEREIVLAGMAVVHRSMPTGSQRFNDIERRRRFQPIDRVFDQLAADVVAAGRPASVIVVSVEAPAGRPGVLPTWVGKIRAQLRAGDFAGLLSEKEIAVLLCGASANHAAAVSARLTQMLTAEDSTGFFLYSSVGMTTRMPDSSFEGSIVGAARALAASGH